MFGEIHLNHIHLSWFLPSRKPLYLFFLKYTFWLFSDIGTCSLSPLIMTESPPSVTRSLALPNIVTSFVFVRLQSPAEP